MKTKLIIALPLVVAVLLLLDHLGVPLPGRDSAAERLVARNLVVRGGADAWSKVESLRLTGTMDLGQGLQAPYVLEQKRPDKMRLEFEFDGETIVQTVDGDKGWKFAPFQGQLEPVLMTEVELRETAASGSPGLLFDYEKLGHEIELLGLDEVEGKEALKLKITLASGAVRWLYLDSQTGLDLKLEAMRNIAGRDQLVETFYRGWHNSGELSIPNRQLSRVGGKDEWNMLTVDKVEVNPVLDDSRFTKPVLNVGLGA